MTIGKTNGTKRAAIYIRVSTLDQARDGYSLAAQKKALEEWAAAHDYEVVRVYEDAGISGKDIKRRPAMRRMLADAEARQFDLLLVWALSRLSRSMTDLCNTWDLLSACNIDFRSLTESFDTSTPTGRLAMGLIGLLTRYELEQTAQRVKAAMAERAAQGKRTCNEVLGYDLDGPDSLCINAAEAERVRYIFDRYQEYRNLSAVAELCELRGYRGKRGRVFKAQHIKTILTRSVYCGYNSYCGELYKGNFEPIIDEAQFRRVQKMLGQKRKGV